MDSQAPDLIAEKVAPDIKPDGWKKPPTLLELKADLEAAKPSHSQQQTKMKTWVDNLRVENGARMKKVQGRSSLQPKLIRKQAEWRYPALSEPFLSAEDMFKASPVTWEDAKCARQNQLVLNNQINTKINKTKFIDSYVRRAVNEGTAIIRVGWEFEEEQVTEDQAQYKFAVNPELGQLHEELHQMMEMNPTGYQFDVPEELQQAHELTMQVGQPIEATIVGMETVEVTKTVKNCPTLELCNYNNVILDPDCEGDIDKAGYVIYSFTTSLSELRKTGKYQNLDEIELTSASPLADPDHAGGGAPESRFHDEPRKRIVAYEYWGFWDYDDSGMTRPFVCTWVGNTMIRLEENPYPDKKVPFIFVDFLPVADSAYGEPDGELLIENQKVTGAVYRGMIDIMARSANGQVGSRKDALDATNRRKFQKGEDYQYNGNVDPRAAFHMHTYPEIPQSAQYMLQRESFEAESMSGVKSFNDGISGNALGESVANGRSALDAASKRETGILRRLADGMVQAGRKIIAMNAEFLDEEEVVRITNDEFEAIRRDDLAGNIDLKLMISTAEEDNAKAERQEFMLQTMGPNMDHEMAKLLMVDIARLRKMPELAKKLEDYTPQPDPAQQQIQQLEMLKLQAEIEVLFGKAGESEADAILAQAKAITEQARAALLGSQADQSDLDFVEQESGVKQERDKELQGAQAAGNIELEKVKQQGEQLRKYKNEKSSEK
jgi:hypothetical protein